MKKLIVVFVAFSVCLISCVNKTISKMTNLYENATKELASAENNEDCDKIHMELLQNICKLMEEDPDFIDDVKKGKYGKSDFEKVDEAYKKYNEKLREATTGSHYMFMPYATPDNALKIIKGKEGAKDKNENNEDEEDSSSF